MPSTIRETECGDMLVSEVVLGQANLAVKDRGQMRVLDLRVDGRGAVTLGADIVAVGAKQLRALGAVRVVAGRASLSEGRLVQDFVLLLGLIDVTIQADVDGIRLGESRRPSGMRVVAIGAVALRARMLKFRFLNFVSLVRVTSDTNVPDLRLRQHDFSVLGSFVADFAKLFAKGRMHERLHQLGLGGLMRCPACAFTRSLSLASWQSRQSAGADFVR